MNNSHRTTDIAHGLYLYALVMNENSAKNIETWNKWANSHSLDTVTFVIVQQSKLFDACLNLDKPKLSDILYV